MEINFEEMSPAEIKRFIRSAEKALQETEEARMKKAKDALHNLFVFLDVLGMRLRDVYSGEIVEELDFRLEFIYGVDEE